VTVVDQDDRAAREHARREVELYLPVVAARDPTVRTLDGDVLGRFAFAGSPARIAEQALALYEAGADRVEFGTPHGIDERRGVELLAAEVLPALQA
jgi:5,10-methylenetetrahydromethanopterin reductase